MRIIDLGGEWTLRQAGKKDCIKATIPGSTHTALLAAGLISDPYFHYNEDRLRYASVTTWIYRGLSISRMSFFVASGFCFVMKGSIRLHR